MKRLMISQFIGFGGLLLFVFLLRVHQANAQDIVTRPSDVAVLKGGTVQLTCQLSRPLDGSKNLQWGQLSENLEGDKLGSFFVAGVNGGHTSPYTDTQKPQLRRYSMNITGNNYDLVIEDAEVQVDDAQYDCWLDSQPATGAQLTVAVMASGPVMYKDDSNEEIPEGDTVDTTEEDTLTLRCETKEGRPKTDFFWYRGNEEINCNNSKCNETVENGDGTYDSSSTLILEPNAYDNGVSVNCTGVQSVGPIGELPSRTILLDVLHGPLVEVVFEVKVLEVHCNTVANPSEIESYVWQINGTEQVAYKNMPSLKEPKELEVGIEFACFAANSFGSGSGSLIIGSFTEPGAGASSSGISSGGIAGIVIALLIVAFVVFVAAFLVLRQKDQSKKDSTRAETRAENTDIEKAGEANSEDANLGDTNSNGEDGKEDTGEDRKSASNEPAVVENQGEAEA